jgi:hypothetical protein
MNIALGIKTGASQHRTMNFQKRHSWIVQWRPHRDVPKLDMRPHLLPYRWKWERVRDYVRCLHWNSALWTPFETLNRLNLSKPTGIFATGSYYGEATGLEMYYVKDLRIFRRETKIVMEWTRPAPKELDRTSGHFVKVGEASRKRFEYSDKAA